MRNTNWRLLVVGLALVVLAFAFFAGMGLMAGHSNDPAAMTATVGQVSGAVGGIGLATAIFGFVGRRTV